MDFCRLFEETMDYVQFLSKQVRIMEAMVNVMEDEYIRKNKEQVQKTMLGNNDMRFEFSPNYWDDQIQLSNILWIDGFKSVLLLQNHDDSEATQFS